MQGFFRGESTINSGVATEGHPYNRLYETWNVIVGAALRGRPTVTKSGSSCFVRRQ